MKQMYFTLQIGVSLCVDMFRSVLIGVSVCIKNVNKASFTLNCNYSKLMAFVCSCSRQSFSTVKDLQKYIVGVWFVPPVPRVLCAIVAKL